LVKPISGKKTLSGFETDTSCPATCLVSALLLGMANRVTEGR
jgi:hypothetical protein